MPGKVLEDAIFNLIENKTLQTPIEDFVNIITGSPAVVQFRLDLGTFWK
jgi:hypothetical protein